MDANTFDSTLARHRVFGAEIIDIFGNFLLVFNTELFYGISSKRYGILKK